MAGLPRTRKMIDRGSFLAKFRALRVCGLAIFLQISERLCSTTMKACGQARRWYSLIIRVASILERPILANSVVHW